jgi:hypothetical protein
MPARHAEARNIVFPEQAVPQDDSSMKILTSLALIDPAVLPALRMAGTVFLMINLIGGAYIFLNRHRFFDRDPNVTNDVAAVRHLRVEVVLVPWLALTATLLGLLIRFWLT